MHNKKRLTLILLLTLIFPYGIIEINAALTNIPFSGLYEIPIGQWDPWPLDYRFTIYAIPSLEGSNDISWSLNRDTISPGESLTLRIELHEGTYYLRMDFRIKILKKSTNQVLVDETVGGYLPAFSVPGSLTSPKYSLPIIPLEEFFIPAELSVHFRVNLDTSLITSLTATGLNPAIINENFQISGTKNIAYSKPSGVGANLELTSTSLRATGSIIASLGLSVINIPTPFSIDFASVPITDWIVSDYQRLNIATLKTPINIDFSPSRSIVNLGDLVTFDGYVTPSAQNILLQLLVDGISISSTQTRGDGTFSLSFQPTNPGTFSVSVKSLESTYTTSTTSTSKSLIVNKPPEASFRYSPLGPRVTENIQFTDESYDQDGQIVDWDWSFGDGSSSSLSNPAHTYSQSGSYTVGLTIMDNNGASNSYTKTISVTKIPTGISIRTSNTQVYIGESMLFSGSIDPSVSGANLKISITQPDSITIERSVSSHSDGSYEYSYTPTVSGTWSVKASWDGDYAHKFSTSNSVMFSVLSATGHLRVEIRDENGNSISGATLTSTSQPSGQTPCTSTSDTEGIFTFRDLKRGDYSFDATCNGYEDQSISTNILAGETSEVIITLEKKQTQTLTQQPISPSTTESTDTDTHAQTGIHGFSNVSVIIGFIVAIMLIYSNARERSPGLPTLEGKFLQIHNH